MMRCAPLNYASSCILDLQRGVDAFIKNGSRVDAARVKSLINTIQTAQHFVLPDGGVLFDDELRGIRNKKIRLPYPIITVEWRVDQSGSEGLACSKRIAVVQEIRYAELQEHWAFDGAPPDFVINDNADNLCILVFAVSWVDNLRMWVPAMGGILVSESWDARVGYQRMEPMFGGTRHEIGQCQFVPLLLETADVYIKRAGKHTAMREMLHDITSEWSSVLELCEALTCSNVGTEKIQSVPASVNAKRVRDNKLPLYDAWCLTVETPSSRAGAAHGGYGGHASPREHLRRGHIRRLDADRSVWVNAHVVGTGGRIDKNYRVVTARTNP